MEQSPTFDKMLKVLTCVSVSVIAILSILSSLGIQSQLPVDYFPSSPNSYHRRGEHVEQDILQRNGHTTINELSKTVNGHTELIGQTIAGSDVPINNDAPVMMNQSVVNWVTVEREDLVPVFGKSKSRRDAIVIESHKLIFFPIAKVGCSVWKMLFKRMMGHPDWKSGIRHDPRKNGLRYLSHYNRTMATSMMNDPTYTRAIFVRDPKERLLSAYLDKALTNDGVHIKESCCNRAADKEACAKQFRPFAEFVQRAQQCGDPHWKTPK